MSVSSYSSKRNTPPCAHRECSAAGTRLARASDRPVWVCEAHEAELRDRR